MVATLIHQEIISLKTTHLKDLIGPTAGLMTVHLELLHFGKNLTMVLKTSSK
jgi:hypothetical protein